MVVKMKDDNHFDFYVSDIDEIIWEVIDVQSDVNVSVLYVKELRNEELVLHNLIRLNSGSNKT